MLHYVKAVELVSGWPCDTYWSRLTYSLQPVEASDTWLRPLCPPNPRMNLKQSWWLSYNHSTSHAYLLRPYDSKLEPRSFVTNYAQVAAAGECDR